MNHSPDQPLPDPAQPKPRPRRILALDPGDRRTGVAGTDPSGSIALPLGCFESRDQASWLAAVDSWIEERQPEVIVVGVPIRARRDGGGHLGERALRSLALIEQLRGRHPELPILAVDEAHSTDEAHQRLKSAGVKAARRRRLDDAVAALVILERYLAS